MKVVTPIGVAQKLVDKKRAYDAAAPERERQKQIRREEAARARAEYERQQAERRREEAQREKERIENLPNLQTFVIQQVREVTVAAPNLEEALKIGKSAYNYGQSSLNDLVNELPRGATGDTVDRIRTVQIAAVR